MLTITKQPGADTRKVTELVLQATRQLQSSLPAGRVLEEAPGEMPVILAYKLNGEFLTGRRGGPVRMLVPEAYGFKSIKWLQRIVFTNNHQSDDTYANGNNDINSWLKTFARFADFPDRIKAGEELAIQDRKSTRLNSSHRT